MADRTTQVADEVEVRINHRRDVIRASFKDSEIPLGFDKVEDDVFALYFEEKLNMWPPMILTDNETGESQLASPWLVALALVPDGEKWLERWEKVRGVTDG